MEKKNIWGIIIQTLITILTAIGTTLWLFHLKCKIDVCICQIPVGAGVACPNAPTNRAIDVFGRADPRPYDERAVALNKPFFINLKNFKLMINYSVCLLGNPQDEMAPEKAYAKPQMAELMSFNKFVKHIADHNGVYTRGTVKGVISDMCECLVEMLLEGKKVQLGDLGNFWISLSSEGAESLKAFTASNITSVNIIFTPGDDFQNLLSRAEFNPVSSRSAQKATLKAEKEGLSTVDLEAAKA